MAAERLRFLIEIASIKLHAFALHEFHDERGDVVFLQLIFERLQIAHVNVDNTGNERSESFMEIGIRGDGKSPVAEAVIGILQRDDTRAAGRALGEFERAFDRFGAAVAEEYGVEMGRALLGETF